MSAASQAGQARRLLFLAHRMPYPPDKGERVRAYREILALREHFDVTVAAPLHQATEEQAGQDLARQGVTVLTGRAGKLPRGAMSMLLGRSITEGYFASRSLRRAVRAAGPFDVAFGYSSSMLPHLLAAPAIHRVMDLVDVDSRKWASYATSARRGLRWLMGIESCRVAALERRAVRDCEAVWLVSEAEARAAQLNAQNVFAVGNGVDAEWFCPGIVPPADLGPEALVFTGTMDYRPNIEGVCWFAEKVWPELKHARSAARFVIVGRDPVPAVRQLAGVDGIEVTGSVPDVRPYLQAAALAICPLRMARGVQNKVLEAMAMGQAVVASPAAVEGLDVTVGTHLLQADTPDQWHDILRASLEDVPRRNAIGSAAREHILQQYTWRQRLGPMIDCICRIAKAGPGESNG